MHLCIPYNAQANIVRDAESEDLIKSIAKPLLVAAGLDAHSYKAYLVLNDTPNAFVMGGNNIFVHTGLFKIAKTPQMLGGVLAHEIGHIKSNHVTLRLSKMREMNNMLMIAHVLALATRDPNVMTASMLTLYESLVKSMMSFSRIHEMAADKLGVDYCAKSGIGINGMLDVLKAFERNDVLYNSTRGSYLSTHPDPRNRLISVAANAKTYDKLKRPNPIDEKINARYDMLLSKIEAYSTSPMDIIKHVKNDKGNESNASYFYKRAIAYYRNGNTMQALDNANKAIALDQENPYLIEFVGHIYFANGNLNKSIECYKKAYEGKKSDRLLLSNVGYALANKCYTDGEETASCNESIRILRSILDEDRDDVYIWHKLATVYQKMSNDAGYSSCMAYMYYVSDNKSQTKRFVKKAKDSSNVDKLDHWLQNVLSEAESG